MKSKNNILEEIKNSEIDSKNEKIKQLESTIRLRDNEITNLKQEKKKIEKELDEVKGELTWYKRTLNVIQNVIEYVPTLKKIVDKIIDKVSNLSNYYDENKITKEINVELGLEEPEAAWNKIKTQEENIRQISPNFNFEPFFILRGNIKVPPFLILEHRGANFIKLEP